MTLAMALAGSDGNNMALNVKRRKFCREYMVDGNGAQAAIRAGYTKRSAYSTACYLLNM
ncbi:MAG: terminase small subunit [Alphaproteobacteria bacterium]|nr:terminase small subunit [Alphaproteobacteria bacterium]